MLQEYYDQLKTEYTKNVKSFEASIQSIRKNPTIENLSVLQNSVISFGTYLEDNWNAKGTPVITLLETIVEDIFLLTQEGTDIDTSLKALSDNISNLHTSFDDTFKLTDYGLSIVIMFKNEAKYLKEWIEYHQLVGVDHFYIYDNESTDNSLEVLKPYIEKGIVTYKYYPGDHIKYQPVVYTEAINCYKNDTKYMAFFDGDEFLVPKTCDNILTEIENIFANYKTIACKWGGFEGPAGIGVNWRVFGTNHFATNPDGLVTENYTLRAPDDIQMNYHIKTICNPREVDSFVNPHFANYKPGHWCISENGSLIPWAFFYDGKCEKLQLNHYHLRSEEHLQNRLNNWLGDPNGPWKKQVEKESVLCNEMEDKCIQRFVPSLKQNMSK